MRFEFYEYNSVSIFYNINITMVELGGRGVVKRQQERQNILPHFRIICLDVQYPTI